MPVVTLPDPAVADPTDERGVPPRRRGTGSVVRGRPEDPPWVRPALLALLAGTAVLYLWGLGASGWANSFYSAAVQAGTKSWNAFFFGSSDAASFITVDKPPTSLWVMALSARLFGVNAWSILVPQALEGVAAVGVLYLAVRRWFSPAAGLLAGAIVALTPVAALMFRFNNPDALLTLLLTVAAYAVIRALDYGSTRWLVLAGSVVGLGFLTKMLQALLVVPALALVYLVAAIPPLRRRIVQLIAFGATIVVSAGWWVAVVELVPASARPYIGGSQDNSILSLIFGYNGFGRLTGNETGSVGGGPAGQAGRWGPTGWGRLFNADYGGQISWLLPAALVLLAAGLVLTWRARRTDRTRASLLLWGGWLVVTGAVFSLSQGIIHSYYTVVLAPAIGALVGIMATVLWRRRQELVARALLAATIAVTALWAWVLLDRTPSWLPWLRTALLVLGLGAAVGVLGADRLRGRGLRVVVAAGLVAAMAGPAAYTVATATTTHEGALPSAGPRGAGGFAGPGGPPGGLGGPGAGPGGFATGGRFPRNGAFPAGGGQTAPPAQGGAGGVLGGLLNGSTPSDELVSVLDTDAGAYTWVAATVGANQASGYQLATDEPVMAIGGFNGTDPTPTLAEFQALVADGRIHYFIAGGQGGPGGAGPRSGSSTSSSISSWVESTFTPTTIGGVTLYDLTTPA